MAVLDYSLQYGKWTREKSNIPEFHARRYISQLSPWMPKSQKEKILEIGPGNGLALALLLDAGYEAEGIEADEVLASRLIAKGLPVKWISAENIMAHLKDRQDSYALIYANNVIEHVPMNSQIGFVEAISSALQPGGFFVCDTPNALSPIAAWYRYIDWTHTCLFTTMSLEFLLLSGNLEPIYIGAADDRYPPPVGGMLGRHVKKIGAKALLLLSRSLFRIHVAAELGLAGLRQPVTPDLLAVGRKQHAKT